MSEDPDASEDSKVMLSTLTRTQAAAVEKRVELLKQTLRKRNKQYHAPDVREIFKPPPGSTAHSEGTQVRGERPACFCNLYFSYGYSI